VGKIIGTEIGETLYGSNSHDTIYGLAGDDSILARAGSDLVDGGTGSDTIQGDLGDDSLYGGDGDDRILDRGGGSDRIDGGDGNDVFNDFGIGGSNTFAGGAGDDTIYQNSGKTDFDLLIGGTGDDNLWDYFGGDARLIGGAGNDFVAVLRPDDDAPINAGSTTLNGGDGDDTISAATAYKDKKVVMSGGAGDDTIKMLELRHAKITGGVGDDYFLFNSSGGSLKVSLGSGSDTVAFYRDYYSSQSAADGVHAVAIKDFQAGTGGDIVDVHQMIEWSEWSGADPFKDGFLRLHQTEAGTELQVVSLGDGQSYSTVAVLKGLAATELTADNFQGYDPFVS
jgi:Ca2+-binding RTX toxin-like protein